MATFIESLRYVKDCAAHAVTVRRPDSECPAFIVQPDGTFSADETGLMYLVAKGNAKDWAIDWTF